MRATYNPEDNKLRLYPDGEWIAADDWQRLKAAGFIWARIQECLVKACWTPEAEDLLLEFVDDIGDEDYAATERSADRAERYEDYRDKRADEAGAHADAFESGPTAFGHQSRARAERQARRHDRHRGRALSQWDKAEYWHERTRAVIAHARYKASAHVRRGRIKELETHRRKHADEHERRLKIHRTWKKVHEAEGADLRIAYKPAAERTPGIAGTLAPHYLECAALAYGLAYTTAAYGAEYTSPRDGKTGTLFSLIGPDSDNPISPREAAALWLAQAIDHDDPQSRSMRWLRHYDRRLEYERAMLAEEGGAASEEDMEPGGWILTSTRTYCPQGDAPTGWSQIQKVNKSNTTGRVVSVQVSGTTTGWGNHAPRPCLVTYNVERLPANAYRAPTDEERAAFKTKQATAKAERRATAPKKPPLINPTPEDARRLQALINDRLRAAHAKRQAKAYGTLIDFAPLDIMETTQAKYSANSKGAYARCETRALHACGRLRYRTSDMWSSCEKTHNDALGAHVCDVRLTVEGWTDGRIIVLTDKPQKPLPLDWEALERTDVIPIDEPIELMEVQ